MKEQVKSASQVDNQDDEDEEDDAVVETEVGFLCFPLIKNIWCQSF